MTETEKYQKIAYMGVNRTNLPDEREVVMKAVVKQVPKKPEFVTGYNDCRNENTYAVLCPECGATFIEWSDSDIDKAIEGDLLFPNSLEIREAQNSYDYSDIEKTFRDYFCGAVEDGRQKYCDACGQRIDWSEQEENE